MWRDVKSGTISLKEALLLQQDLVKEKIESDTDGKLLVPGRNWRKSRLPLVSEKTVKLN